MKVGFRHNIALLEQKGLRALFKRQHSSAGARTPIPQPTTQSVNHLSIQSHRKCVNKTNKSSVQQEEDCPNCCSCITGGCLSPFRSHLIVLLFSALFLLCLFWCLWASLNVNQASYECISSKLCWVNWREFLVLIGLRKWIVWEMGPTEKTRISFSQVAEIFVQMFICTLDFQMIRCTVYTWV